MISTLIAPEAARRSGSYSLGDSQATSLFGGGKTNAGVEVDEREALTLPAMFCACNLMASHMAMLPLPVKQRVGPDDNEPRPDHPVHRLLNAEPNEEVTSFALRRAWHLHRMLWGDGDIEIERTQRGNGVVNLWTLLPGQVNLRRGLDKRLRFDVYRTDGTTDVFDPSDVCHITNLSTDGLKGYGIIRELARENVGLGLALMRYAESFFGNHMMFGVVLTTPDSMTMEKKRENLEGYERHHQDPSRAFRGIILDGGLKAERPTPDHEAAQLIEEMTLSIQDVSRWTGALPPFLMELSRGTFSNIKVLGEWHVKFQLTPLMKPDEQELNRKLFTEEERRAGYFVEYNAEGMLRGDPDKRAAFYRIMSEVAGMTQNEIRAKENMRNLGEAGDVATQPLNVGQLGGTDNEGEEPPPSSSPPPPRKRRRGRSSAELRQSIADAHRPLFDDVIQRMGAIETRAKTRALKAGKTEAEWAEDFYPDHAIKFRSAIIPAVEALGGAIRATLPDTILDEEWLTFTAEFAKECTEKLVPHVSWTPAYPVDYFLRQLEERFGT